VALLLDRIVTHSDTEPVVLHVDRVDLYRKRFRVQSEHHGLVAIDLESPPKHDILLTDVVGSVVFRIEQNPEEICEIPIPEDASFSAKIGWYLGNRHIPIEVTSEVIRLENFPTLVDSLDRIGIKYHICEGILRCAPHSADHRHED